MKLKQALKYSWIATIIFVILAFITAMSLIGNFDNQTMLILLNANVTFRYLFYLFLVTSIILSIVKWAKERKNAK